MRRHSLAMQIERLKEVVPQAASEANLPERPVVGFDGEFICWIWRRDSPNGETASQVSLLARPDILLERCQIKILATAYPRTRVAAAYSQLVFVDSIAGTPTEEDWQSIEQRLIEALANAWHDASMAAERLVPVEAGNSVDSQRWEQVWSDLIGRRTSMSPPERQALDLLAQMSRERSPRVRVLAWSRMEAVLEPLAARRKTRHWEVDMKEYISNLLDEMENASE